MTAAAEESESADTLAKVPPEWGAPPITPQTPAEEPDAQMSETDDATISFAKRLAHNNKQTRQAALKKVKRWLVTKSKHGTLDYDNIIKIWKGLHYSMWYSDKPVTQEALALDISQTIMLFHDVEDAVSFFAGFCETIAREWVLIDRLRLDKYYMFIKTALACVLELCQVNNWNEKVVSDVIDVLDVRIINSTCPDSIAVYISEQFYSIYSEIYTTAVPNLFLTKLLMSYVTVISQTPKRDLNRVIMTNLFNPIISSEVSFNIDLPKLSAHIYTVAKHPDILTRNRKLLYKLRSELSTALVSHATSPLGKRKAENSGGNAVGIDENADLNVNNVVETEVTKTMSKPTKKKKKKLKSIVEKEECDVLKEEEEGDVTRVEKEPALCLPPTLSQEEIPDLETSQQIHEHCEVIQWESQGLPDISEEPEQTPETEESGDAPLAPTAGDAPLAPTAGDAPLAPTTGDATLAPTAGDATLASDDLEITDVSPGVKRSKTTRKSVNRGSKTPEQNTSETPEQEPSTKRKRRKSKNAGFTPTPDSTPTPTTSTTKKKVRLSLENNQTFFFKKNTSLDSPVPFDGARTPTKSALKASPALTRSQGRKKANSRVKR